MEVVQHMPGTLVLMIALCALIFFLAPRRRDLAAVGMLLPATQLVSGAAWADDPTPSPAAVTEPVAPDLPRPPRLAGRSCRVRLR